MRFSQNFVKTQKVVKAGLESINAKLLTQAGFIHQEIAGVYTFLPLGLLTLRKIEDVVRKEMDKIAVEVLMPTLSAKTPWKTTGRLDSVDVLFKAQGANKHSLEKNSTEYVVNYSHEEIITPLAQKYINSYKDLPKAVYQIQTKFRNEPRAKSGLLRGREFRMKDLYSFHANQADFEKYYETVKQSYLSIYSQLGLGNDTFVTFASGGGFSEAYSHEFQTVLPNGEDIIYLDRKNSIAYNKEVANESDAKKLGVEISALQELKACEVGNIFTLENKYSKAFNFTYTSEDNREHLVTMGCYGLGTSRVMGVIAEKFADRKGLVWPANIAPFKIHLIGLDLIDPKVKKTADEVYQSLIEKGNEVLFDDRVEVSAGEKFTDADLIGIPNRVVVSSKTDTKLELKQRISDQLKLITLEELLHMT